MNIPNRKCQCGAKYSVDKLYYYAKAGDGELQTLPLNEKQEIATGWAYCRCGEQLQFKAVVDLAEIAEEGDMDNIDRYRYRLLERFVFGEEDMNVWEELEEEQLEIIAHDIYELCQKYFRNEVAKALSEEEQDD